MRKFGIAPSPGARPAELPGWLEGAGLRVRDAWSKTWRAAGPAADVPTDLRLEHIEPGRAEQFGELACAGFGMPATFAPVLAAGVGREGWHHYIAFDRTAALAGPP